MDKVAGLVVAAALVAGGAWYLTRTPEGQRAAETAGQSAEAAKGAVARAADAVAETAKEGAEAVSSAAEKASAAARTAIPASPISRTGSTASFRHRCNARPRNRCGTACSTIRCATRSNRYGICNIGV